MVLLRARKRQLSLFAIASMRPIFVRLSNEREQDCSRWQAKSLLPHHYKIVGYVSKNSCRQLRHAKMTPFIGWMRVLSQRARGSIIHILRGVDGGGMHSRHLCFEIMQASLHWTCVPRQRRWDEDGMLRIPRKLTSVSCARLVSQRVPCLVSIDLGVFHPFSHRRPVLPDESTFFKDRTRFRNQNRLPINAPKSSF